MKKLVISAALATFMATSASAAVLDAFDLDVSSSAAVESNITLDVGTAYYVTVMGTVTISNGRNSGADAEYFNLSNPTDALGGNEIGVGIDGADVDFGPFSATSTYTTTVIGDGTSIELFFQDNNYNGNDGSLEVTISSVPLPASAALLLTGLGALSVARRRAA